MSEAVPLEVAYLSPMPEQERGGTAVLLLQGWAAPPDELMPLAQKLVRPGTRMFVPAAPLSEPEGGRAWWWLGPNERPAWAWEDEAADGHEPHPLVTAARTAVLELVATVRGRYAPDQLAVIGFSQGAMLALDAGLRAGSGVDRVAALSGVLLADTQAAWGEPGPRVLVAHGRLDDEVPFTGGERARELLERHGYHVTWRPFDGGHEIPAQTVAALEEFLFTA